MSKASESQLAILHGAVAKALTECVQGMELAREDGSIEKIAPSAAHIMAAITFLKNNSITADPEANKDLAELNKALTERRSRSKLKMLNISDVADVIERDLGGVFNEGT